MSTHTCEYPVHIKFYVYDTCTIDYRATYAYVVSIMYACTMYTHVCLITYYTVLEYNRQIVMFITDKSTTCSTQQDMSTLNH